MKKKDCECWEKRDQGLREKYGLKIADECSALFLDTDKLDLAGAYCLPLARVDGTKLKRADPKIITISFCPFCGRKYT